MTFEEFKIIIEGVRTGDKPVPKDEVLIVLLNQAIETIARKVEPLTLRSNDINDEILTHLKEESEYFIRKPEPIKDDESLLDIDENLHFAVAYQTAILFCSKKSEYISLRNMEITDYDWLIYNTLEGMENE